MFHVSPSAKIEALIYEIKNISEGKGTLSLPLSPSQGGSPLSLERLELALIEEKDTQEEKKDGMMDQHRFVEVVTGVAYQQDQDIQAMDAGKWALAVWVR